MWPFNPADLFVPLTCGPALAPELAGTPCTPAISKYFAWCCACRTE